MIIKTDDELFELSVQAALRIPPKNSIGTKSEHRLHGALKYYFQPDDTFHEIRTDGYICDALDGDTVIEIQTSAFERLRKKLGVLLKTHPVTVIYPIIREKRIQTVYSGSGEHSERKSPQKGSITDIFSELYKIREYITHPGFCLKIAIVDAEEKRIYPKARKDRKPFQKPIKTERIPTGLVQIISFGTKDDYRYFLPENLPETFGSKEFAKTASVPRTLACSILLILTITGVVERIGMRGKAYIYRISDTIPENPENT